MDASLPASVTAALDRVCGLVDRQTADWTVGGDRAAPGVSGLAEALYEHWYTQPAAPPPPATGDPPLHSDSLLSALRAAHAGASEMTVGWTVTATDPRGVLSAVNGDAARLLRPGDYVMPLRPGVPPAPGERVEPVARLDNLDVERGIWWTFTDPGPEPPIGRLYFDARPATAPRAVHEITAALANLTFQMKCPISIAACDRVDAIVLYHPRAARDELLAALSEHWTTLEALLDPAVPPLTCAVRPGVGWADDTADDRSYGESRCHLFATAIDSAAASWDAMDGDERCQLLADALRSAGNDPKCPWVSAA